jgi:excisionase family DNA binding protein
MIFLPQPEAAGNAPLDREDRRARQGTMLPHAYTASGGREALAIPATMPPEIAMQTHEASRRRPVRRSRNAVRAPLVQMCCTGRNSARARHEIAIREACVGVGHGQNGEATGRRMGRRMTITVEEAAEMLGISRTSAYGCATRNEIPTVRLGRRVLVPLARLMAMLDDEPPEPETGEADDDDAA